MPAVPLMHTEYSAQYVRSQVRKRYALWALQTGNQGGETSGETPGHAYFGSHERGRDLMDLLRNDSERHRPVDGRSRSYTMAADATPAEEESEAELGVRGGFSPAE